MLVLSRRPGQNIIVGVGGLTVEIQTVRVRETAISLLVVDHTGVAAFSGREPVDTYQDKDGFASLFVFGPKQELSILLAGHAVRVMVHLDSNRGAAVLAFDTDREVAIWRSELVRS